MSDEISSALPEEESVPEADVPAGVSPVDSGEIVDDIEVTESFSEEISEGGDMELEIEDVVVSESTVVSSDEEDDPSEATGKTPKPELDDSDSIPPRVPLRSKANAGDDITENDRLMAALAYFLWFIGPAIILLSQDMKMRSFQRYHAVQALGVAVILSIASFVLFVLGLVLCCVWVLLLIPLGVTLYCMLEAYGGKYFSIPIITNVMISEGWLKEG